VLNWCIDVPKSSIERIRRKERAQYSRGAEAISEAKRSTHASAFTSGWPSGFETIILRMFSKTLADKVWKSVA
jgi:hypothetical protein